jgi:3-oxoacyl-[acyl-carrier-protein] synthase II
MRRVVITGIGAISPLGINNDYIWNNVINGKIGITKIQDDYVKDLPVSIAGLIPSGSKENNALDLEEWFSTKDIRRNDKFILYALIAARKAMQDCGYIPTEEQKEKSGVIVSSGVGGLEGIYQASLQCYQDYSKVSPFFIPSVLINLASGLISIEHGFKGENISIVTACATGTHSIGEALKSIKYGTSDFILAGGAEAPVCRIGITGFARMNALATGFNDNPQEASRPWDKKRKGFVMGEGAGVFALEELEHAKKRGAKIYAEVVGYGASSDASHITAPLEDGAGAALAMKKALEFANLSPDKIGYINAHGTSTPLGDLAELKAVKKIFANSLSSISMSSTKSMTGHLLGAAGAVEAFFCIKALETGILPPTMNLIEQEEECNGVDLIPNKLKEKKVDYVLSNSFGFGGTNGSIIFKKFTD